MTNTVEAGKRRRLDYIDSMRGLAAMGVALFHSGIALDESNVPLGVVGDALLWLFTDLMDLGKISVVLFFAISGFIVPVSLLRGGNRPSINFIVTRFFRLYPVYWVSLALCLLVAGQVTGIEATTRLVLVNLTMVQGFVGVHDINGVSWTLQIELVFYFACLMLYLTTDFRSPRTQFLAALAMLGVAVAMAAGRYMLMKKLPVALPLALTVMFFGCLWRGWVLDRNQVARRYVRSLLIGYAILFPAICVLAYSRDFGFDETWYRYLLSYGAALGVFMMCSTLWKLEFRPLVYLGRISYSIYLLNPVVFSLGLQHALPSSMLEGLAWVVGVLVVTAAVGHVSYRLIELPSVAAGRWVSRQFSRRTEGVALATAERTL